MTDSAERPAGEGHPDATELSPSCHVVSAQHTATLVFSRLRARWPQAAFRVRVCDQTVPVGPEESELEGLNVEWSDGPTIAEVEAAVAPFGGAELDPQSQQLRRRESLLATPRAQAVLVNYRVGYLRCRRPLSASYRRDLRCCAAVLGAHGRQLLDEHLAARRQAVTDAGGERRLGQLEELAEAFGEHPLLATGLSRAGRGRHGAGPGLLEQEVLMLRTPGSTWTPWGISLAQGKELLELLSRHLSPDAAASLLAFPVTVQVAMLSLLELSPE